MQPNGLCNCQCGCPCVRAHVRVCACVCVSLCVRVHWSAYSKLKLPNYLVINCKGQNNLPNVIYICKHDIQYAVRALCRVLNFTPRSALCAFHFAIITVINSIAIRFRHPPPPAQTRMYAFFLLCFNCTFNWAYYCPTWRMLNACRVNQK